MPRIKLFSVLLVVMGFVSLVGGSALFGSHHSIALGSLAIGVVLVIAGAGAAWRARPSGLSQKLSRSKSLGSSRWSSNSRLQTLIAALIIGGATVGSYLYVSSQVSAQSGTLLGPTLSVDSASEATYPDGSVGVTVHVSAIGGVPPYTFFAAWGDRINQTSTTGNFTRIFGAAVPLSTAVEISARSASSGLGFISLSLPSQVPQASGEVNKRNLNIVPSNGAQGSQAGNSVSRTQTSVTSAFIAVINASTPALATTSTSFSTLSASSFSSTSGARTSSSGGFEVIVIVRGASGHAIGGARVTLDGSTTQSTPVNGTVFFLGIGHGDHKFFVSYGAWSITIPYIAGGNPSVRLFVDVPGQ